MSFATVFLFILKVINRIIYDKILAKYCSVCFVLCAVDIYVLRLKVAVFVFSVWLVCMPGILYLHKLAISIVVILNV